MILHIEPAALTGGATAHYAEAIREHPSFREVPMKPSLYRDATKIYSYEPEIPFSPG